MQILVRNNNVDQALKALKRKMQREGIFREMKAPRTLREAFGKESTREGGGHPPRPQAGAQARAARRPHPRQAQDTDHPGRTLILRRQ